MGQGLLTIGVLLLLTLAVAACGDGQPKPGDEFRDCSECPVMVVIQPGKFMMGASPEEVSGAGDSVRPGYFGTPQVKVTIGNAFAVGKFEVSIQEFTSCVQDGGCGSRQSSLGEQYPIQSVTGVSWYNAKNYVAWLSKKTGKHYRLLSESEWEYVSRAGTTTAFWWGDDPGRNRAAFRYCCDKTSPEELKDLGNKFHDIPIEDRFRPFLQSHTLFPGALPGEVFLPNAFGLYQTIGNVDEWVEDCWHPSLEDEPRDGTPWRGDDPDCQWRVTRGGNYVSPVDYVRNSVRNYLDSRMNCVEDSGPPNPICLKENTPQRISRPIIGLRVARDL